MMFFWLNTSLPYLEELYKIMSYLAYKHLHTSFATLSIIFFIIRAYWTVLERGCLQNTFLRVAPHIIATLSLLSGLALAFTIGFTHPWLIAKISALFANLYAGIYAIRRGRTPQIRLLSAVIAVLIYVYIVGIALNKSVLSFFA